MKGRAGRERSSLLIPTAAMATGGGANDPNTLGLPESVTSAVAKVPSLMQLPLSAARALLAPGSGEVGPNGGRGADLT